MTGAVAGTEDRGTPTPLVVPSLSRDPYSPRGSLMERSATMAATATATATETVTVTVEHPPPFVVPNPPKDHYDHFKPLRSSAL